MGILDIISDLACGQIARRFHLGCSREDSRGRGGSSVDAAGEVTGDKYTATTLSVGRGDVSREPSEDGALI